MNPHSASIDRKSPAVDYATTEPGPDDPLRTAILDALREAPDTDEEIEYRIMGERIGTLRYHEAILSLEADGLVELRAFDGIEGHRE